MEREKRLELETGFPQSASAGAVSKPGEIESSQTDAHVLRPSTLEPALPQKTPVSVSQREVAALMLAHPDLLEIAAKWSDLNPAIKGPIMAMVRGSQNRTSSSLHDEAIVIPRMNGPAAAPARSVMT